MKIKTVRLIGLGAMGSFLVPGLCKTLGDDFKLIAEGKRKTRLETNGTTINDKNYIISVEEPKDGSPVDVIIIGTKYTHLQNTIKDIKHFVGKDTIIISLLNGIDSEAIIAETYGWEHLIYCLMRVSVVMKNYCSTLNATNGRIVFGEAKNNTISPRIQAIMNLFDEAEIPYLVPEDMVKEQWLKYSCNIGENQTQAILGVPFGAFHNNEHANFIRVKAMLECIEVARKLGIHINDKEVEQQSLRLKNIPYENKSSTLQDIENGRETEKEMFSGKLIQLGKQLGVATPINEFFYHALCVLEDKNNGKI